MAPRIELSQRATLLTLRFEGMPPRPLYLLLHGKDGAVILESTLPSGSAGIARLRLPRGGRPAWAEVVDQPGSQIARSDLAAAPQAARLGPVTARRHGTPTSGS